MDTAPDVFHPLQMAKRRVRRTFLGEWLAYRGKRNIDLAKAIDKGESYVSLLVSNTKPGGLDTMIAIAEFLECDVRDLYAPPPSGTEEELARVIQKAVHKFRRTA